MKHVILKYIVVFTADYCNTVRTRVLRSVLRSERRDEYQWMSVPNGNSFDFRKRACGYKREFTFLLLYE